MAEKNQPPEENLSPKENSFSNSEDPPLVDREKLQEKFEALTEMGLFPTPKMMKSGKVYVVTFNTSDQASIFLNRLKPSPFQPREKLEHEYSTLRALAEDIQRIGLLTPILVRLKLNEDIGNPENFCFEILGGHRRVQSLLKYTIEKEVQVRIYIVNDLEAHHIVISDNLQRLQLSPIEEMIALTNLADQHFQEKETLDYPIEEKTPAQRVYKFLSQISALKRKKGNGTADLGEKEQFYNTGILNAEQIFIGLPKSLKWESFLKNDLSILQKSDETILQRAIQLSLNKKQTKAYQQIYQTAVETEQVEAFHRLENLQEKSVRELLLIAKQFKNKARRIQTAPNTTHSKNAMIHYLRRLGYTQSKIAEKVGWSISTVSSKLNSNTFPLIIQQELKQGKSSAEIAATYQCPEALVLEVSLQGKNELERWEKIQWELKTQPRWSWVKGDLRFAEKEVAEIQPQLIAHMLYYFVPEETLLLEAIAENALVSQVCLALNRRCLSLSTPEKSEQYPSLFPHVWNDPPEWFTEWTEQPNAIYLKQNQIWPAHQLESFFELAQENSGNEAKLLYLYQERFEGEEPQSNLSFSKVMHLLAATHWELETWIDCSSNIYQPKKEERQQLLSERKLVGNRRMLIVANKAV